MISGKKKNIKLNKPPKTSSLTQINPVEDRERDSARLVSVNCDMGEGIGNDELIMPFINAANIACGYHVGDPMSIWETVELAEKYNVAIGAHISFLDKDNFGRSELKIDNDDIYDLVTQQLIILNEITDELGATINHVKPHGALYNMSAKDSVLATIIARAVKDYNSNLILFGLSGSHSVKEAKRIGLQTVNEVFADRTYQDDGMLTPRSQPNALIHDIDKVVKQVLQMIKEGTVTALSGKTIPIIAETICIHGDGKQAVDFAKAIHDAVKGI